MEPAIALAAGAAVAGVAGYAAYRKRYLARLIASIRLRLNPDFLVSVADSPESVGLERQQVSAIVRSLSRCPRRSEELAEKLISLGLYEDVIYLASRGCSVSSASVARARAYLLGLGLAKWEAEASRLLGESPKLLGGSKLMVAVCEDPYYEVMVDGVVSRVPPPGSEWRSPPAEEVISSIASASGAGLIISWGSCGLGNSIDARLLVSTAYPDVRPQLSSLAYDLDLNPLMPPTYIVLAAAARSVDVLDSVGVDWSRLPEGVSRAKELRELRDLVSDIVRQPQSIDDNVIVTDRVKAGRRVWRPFSVDVSRLEGVRDYVVLVSAKSLSYRGGDPLRAMRNSRAGLTARSLADVLMASLVKSSEPPGPGSQVEPWDLGCLRGVRAKLLCARGYAECAGGLRPPDDEADVLKGLGVSCDADPEVSLEAASYVPPGLAAAVGLKAPSKGKVIAYGEALPGGLRGVSEALAAAVAMVSGGQRPLIVVPSRALAKAASATYGALLISDYDSEERWFLFGGVGVTWWDKYLEMYELGGVADKVVLVFPERMISRGDGREPRGDPVDQVVELVAKNGGLAVSRALGLDRRDDVELVAPHLDEVKEVRLNVSDLLEDADEEFQRLWGKGFRLRSYQRLALEVLFKMVASGSPTAVFVILPTGAGKSAIFQVGAKVLEDVGIGSTAVVLSPLRALMHDQVKNARKRGLRALYIDSSVPTSMRRPILRASRAGVLDLLYITPEGFNLTYAIEALSSSPSLVVLDEAHTLSRWGLSFRPSYLYAARQLKELRTSGWPPILALSATAPPDIVRDVMSELGMGSYDEYRISLGARETLSIEYSSRPVVLRAPPIRPEISVDVVPARAGRERLDDAVEIVRRLVEWADSVQSRWIGVVFVPFVQSRSNPWLNAESVADYISKSLGEQVLVYHGQMGDRKRREVEELILRSSATGSGPRIVVATKAFGMGVDIPNIRWTLHVAPSESVEDLYQEIGRAGRDGLQARGVILYNPSDAAAQSAMAKGEAVKPLAVFRVLSLVQEVHRNLKVKEGPVPLPLNLVGGEWGLVRYLEVLRIAGVLDYEVVKGPLLAYDKPREAVEEAAGWCIELSDGTCIARRVSGAAGRQVYLRYCEGAASLSVSAANDGCRYVPYSSLVALVYLSPEWRRQRKYLDPDVYAVTLWHSIREGSKASEVARILETALAARARGGEQLADSQFKSMLEEALNRDVRPPVEGVRLGKVFRCDRLADCVEQAVRDAAEIERTVGPGSALMGGSSKAVPVYVSAYLKLNGRQPNASESYYRRFASLSRKGRLEEAMNMGYLLLVLKDTSRAEELVRASRGYPYVNFYLYSSS